MRNPGARRVEQQDAVKADTEAFLRWHGISTNMRTFSNARIRLQKLAVTAMLLSLSLQGCTNPSSVAVNPFVTKDSAEKFSLNKQEIQQAYDLSLAKDYLAILGSQLPRSMILNSYWRFLGSIGTHSRPETMQGNFTALGYFSAPTLTVLKKFCISSSPYIGAVIIRQKAVELAKPPCGSHSGTIRIPIGHTMRGFVVPDSNRFATAIPLDALAEASKKDRPVTWSDINPQWPKRPIRWVFNAQTDFKTDLKIMGITPPKRYLLAANYERSFLNVGDHPDNLLFTPTTPSLKAQLQGAQFRIVPIQPEQKSAPIAPVADALNRYPVKLIRTIYVYINLGNQNRCIMADFTDYMLNNNATLMHENNIIPLRPEERMQALNTLKGQRLGGLDDEIKSLCRAYRKSHASHRQNSLVQP